MVNRYRFHPFVRFAPLIVLAVLTAIPRIGHCEGNNISGAKVFSKNCAVCHGPTGRGVIGPSLKLDKSASVVKIIVEHGKGVMPNFSKRLSSQQIQAVAHYVAHAIATTPLTGGNLSEGGVLFRANCSFCHRTAVRGGALVFVHRNAPSLVGKSAGTIATAIRAGPGPMPIFAPSVFNNQQVASIVKYVQHMEHPPAKGGYPMNFYGPVAEGLVSFLAVVAIAMIAGWIEKGGRG